MSPITTLDAPPSPASVEMIVFGSRCKWCEQEAPCHCNHADTGRCACTCGRCLFDGPLPDDGPMQCR